MVEKLEKKADEMDYWERIDSRDKNLPRSVGNYDSVPKLDASMSFRYYGVFV